MDRRHFLRLVASGIIGHELDLDRLLWVPGQKTIFLPSITGVSLSQVTVIEYEKSTLRIRKLFKQNDKFYLLFMAKNEIRGR